MSKILRDLDYYIALCSSVLAIFLAIGATILFFITRNFSLLLPILICTAILLVLAGFSLLIFRYRKEQELEESLKK